MIGMVLKWLKNLLSEDDARPVPAIRKPLPPMTRTNNLPETEDFRPIFVRHATESGCFKLEAIPWLTEVFLEATKPDKLINGKLYRGGFSDTVRKIRCSGDLLDKDGLKAIGKRSNAKVGRRYAEALTAEGLKDEYHALKTVVMKAELDASRFSNLRFFREMAASFGYRLLVRVNFANDSRTCAAVRALDGITFPDAETPALPVAGCDAEWCRCVYTFEIDRK